MRDLQESKGGRQERVKGVCIVVLRYREVRFPVMLFFSMFLPILAFPWESIVLRPGEETKASNIPIVLWVI